MRQPDFPQPIPDVPFWAVGDIHGCADLLERVLMQLDGDIPVVFVGDMVDRGPDSSAVLCRIFKLCAQNPAGYIALRGNHEMMLLDFLSDPARHGAEWMRHGGMQTLESYGIPVTGKMVSDAAWIAARDALRAEMGAPMERWLQALPTVWSSGNIYVVHAGADPATPMSIQNPDHLTWGHADFARVARRDGQWIVHGHTIVQTPTQNAGRIAIDTGAYASGRLTAARLDVCGTTFVTATRDGPQR